MAADLKMEETVQKINTLTEETLTELFLKWKKMYKLTNEFKERSYDTFMTHVEALYENMLTSEESKLLELSEAVEKRLLETVELEKELGVTIPKVDTELPLQDLITELDNAVKKFRLMKQEKLQHFETLLTKEEELCDFLGKVPKPKFSHFPKEKDFDALELYIFEMHQEKIERTEFYNDAKNRINKLMSQLDLKPHSEFEEMLMSNEPPKTLTDDEIIMIKTIESSLCDKVDLQKKNKEFKLNKLQNLWEKLKIPDDIQLEFVETLGDGLTPSVFSKIEEEFLRCEAIKLENIKPLILATREKMEQLWDKVKYSDEQRKEFAPFNSPFFNEDVLELLEIEVERLTTYYEDNITIFELVEKWNRLWAKMIHLEQVSQNKIRLFDNRGGQLLKEEKERKTVENNLPKVYAELVNVLKIYSEENNRPFLWNGQDLLEKIQNDWMQRELKKKTQTKYGMSPGDYLPRSATKRKLQYTPNTPSSVKICKTKSRPVTPISPPDLSSASISSYSVFQEHIESRSRTPAGGTLGENNARTVRTPLHSSPTFTPLKRLRNTPRTMVTPLKATTNSRIPSRIATPISASKLTATTPVTTKNSRFATPSSILKSSSTRKVTPKSNTPLSKSKFTPARKFNLII